jgi:hypothetical protein
MKSRFPWYVASMITFLILAGLICVPGALLARHLPSKIDSSSSQATAGKQAPGPASLSRLPLEAQSTISATLGHDIPAFAASKTASGFQAKNSPNNLAADFTSTGVGIRRGHAHWNMTLQSYGYAQALTPALASVPTANSNRIEYQRGALTEWYVNGPAGLEQGFTLSQPPGPANGQALTLALGLSGNVTPHVDADHRGLSLAASDGEADLRYSGLTARDAAGKELSAWMELRDSQLLVRVDDAHARYPVVIDPWVLDATLTAAGGKAGDFFGDAVAISGNTIVVGAPFVSQSLAFTGAAYVFVESANGWASGTQTAMLTPSDGETNSDFGATVAISGNTIVVGARAENGKGAAYVFVEPVTGWVDSTQTAELTASDAAASAAFGTSVAVNGSTVVVGAPNHRSLRNPPSGAAYVFVEPLTGWANSTQNAILTPSDATSKEGFGETVGVSGNTAAVGTSTTSSAYVFVEPLSGWANSTQTAELSGSDGATPGAVAISGNTVVAGSSGGTLSDGSQLVANLFVEPPTGWADATLPTAQLSESDGPGPSGSPTNVLGNSVAISGSTVAVGWAYASRTSATLGAVYIFVEPGDGWSNTTDTAELTPAVKSLARNLGWSVSIDGNTLATGTPYAAYGTKNASRGETFVYGLQSP